MARVTMNTVKSLARKLSTPGREVTIKEVAGTISADIPKGLIFSEVVLHWIDKGYDIGYPEARKWAIEEMAEDLREILAGEGVVDCEQEDCEVCDG